MAKDAKGTMDHSSETTCIAASNDAVTLCFAYVADLNAYRGFQEKLDTLRSWDTCYCKSDPIDPCLM